MKNKLTILFCIFLLLSVYSKAQNTFKAVVKDSITRELLIGVAASIENTSTGAISDANGLITITNISNGKQRIVFCFIEYKKAIVTPDFPIVPSNIITINLSPDQTDLEEVIVSSTRTNSSIDDLPIKVEVLGQDDMDEESTIVPGNISSILGDLSIITIFHLIPSS